MSVYHTGRTASKIIRHGSICTARFSSTSGVPYPNAKRSSAKERQIAERDQLIKSLKESPGKRDARNFLKHFDTPKKADTAAADAIDKAQHNEWRLTKTGVNLGNLYEPTKAAQDSPVFSREQLPEKRIAEGESIEPLHLALVKLRLPQALDDETLGGIALTLSQMARLGLNIAVVVDCDEYIMPETLELSHAWEELVREQSARIVAALEEFNEPGAFEVDHAMTYCDISNEEIPSTVQVRGRVEVKESRLVFPPIEDGIIPVFPPWAYDVELKKVRVRPDDVILALTREFAGINTQSDQYQDMEPVDGVPRRSRLSTDRPLLDRIILLDPLGGLPCEHRADGAHVFINLEAEYQDVKRDLSQPSLAGSSIKEKSNGPGPNRYTENLDVIQRALKLLPPSSSALIITPAEAAISSQLALLPTPSTGVRTRRSKNPLIHNLLTDKPMISSSLPAPLVTRHVDSTAPNPATFLKKGIPVTVIPDPRTTGPWRPPSPSNPSIELETDPRINFPRLVDLIEDSFRRKLDAHHYLDRVRGRVAGVIIAGDYEGGAICTWETPSSLTTTTTTFSKSTPTTTSTSTSTLSTSTSSPLPPDSSLWVPYLDKFAVLTSSQGSGGVADIVWGALARSCFPAGLVWRSRTSNPVNKWYFERAVGMWNLPGGQWTMFWTTEGVVEEWAKKQIEDKKDESPGKEVMTRWDAYVDVCAGVKPSWADGKKPD